MRSYLWLLLAFLIFFVLQCGGTEDKGMGTPNTKPEITKISLLPANPTIESEITARIFSTDRDQDPVSYQVKWFVNSKEIGEGMMFSSTEIRKGDTVYAEVTPFDGKESGVPVKSGSVILKGVAPRIISVDCTPEILFVTTPHVALGATVEDLDQDSIKLIAHWVINDKVIPDTSTGIALKQYGLKKNDMIMVSLFADDGEFRSNPYTFDLVIANSPPRFSVEVDSIKCRNDSIYYQLPIFDPDGDKINFTLLNAPTGITIDKNTGVIQGLVQDTMGFKISVRAQDTEGDYLDADFTLAPP